MVLHMLVSPLLQLICLTQSDVVITCGRVFNSQCIYYVALFLPYFYLHTINIAPTCLQLVYSMFIAVDCLLLFHQHSSPLCCLVLCTSFIVSWNVVLNWNTMPVSALWSGSEYVVFVNSSVQWNIRWNNRKKASSSKLKKYNIKTWVLIQCFQGKCTVTVIISLPLLPYTQFIHLHVSVPLCITVNGSYLMYKVFLFHHETEEESVYGEL